MRIEGFRKETDGSRVRVAATVIWEDNDRPGQEIYYEIDQAFAHDLTCDPHAFLVGCILPAMRNGEERIALDARICPELRNGLLTVMGLLRTWYGPPRKPIRIEARSEVRYPQLGREEHAGSFLSGGLDSLATLRANRLDFPLDHPRSIKDCLLVHGFDIGGRQGSGPEPDTFERAVRSLSALAEDAKVTLVPVSTNLRHLDDDDSFSLHEFQSAILTSVAHTLSGRLTWIYIASSHGLPRQPPWGSHPMLDPNYSSSDLQVRYDGLRFSRLEKAELIGNWDAALQNIRVCAKNVPGLLNCGRCEKCVRTMLSLVAVGALNRATAFPANDVSPDLLEDVLDLEYLRHTVISYTDVMAPLAEQGRSDLVDVIQKKFAQLDKYLAWEEERDWKGAVKRFDRRLLGSTLYRSYASMRERASGLQKPDATPAS
jgi:hypothetical protein